MADSPCSGQTDSIYDSESDLWKWDLDAAGNALVYPDRNLSQRYHSSRGSFSESFSSFTLHPILAAPTVNF